MVSWSCGGLNERGKMLKDSAAFVFAKIKRLLSRSEKLKRKLESNYGKKPDFHYFDGDLRGIRTYFDYRNENSLDKFLVDDTTWNDLSGDDVFMRINQGISTSGEQYLYYLLRSPAIERDEYEKRQSLINVIEENPDLRLKLQMIFSNLGRRRAVNNCEAFKPSYHNPFRLIIYILLVSALIGSAISFAFTMTLLPVFVVLIISIPVYHELVKNRIAKDLETVHYSVSMVFAAKRIMKLSFPALNKYLTTFYEATERLRPISRVGYVPSGHLFGDMAELLNSLLLLDLITYEFLKNRLGKYHADIFHVHEYIGRLDCAIAISSYRKTLPTYTVPQLDFDSSAVYFHGIDLVHPLIDGAVPNNFETNESVLLTGSNASGKSIFLKTVALNAIFAQGICTVLGSWYSASAFLIYTSMAITDNLLAGESYFISEIKSLKRITNVDTSERPLLCIIDEILRGTNTVERISASSELLRYLSHGKSLCLAATHDVELCALLSGFYRLLHFEETVTEDGDVVFDYKIKEGPATTRNALKLLRSMGFDKDLVSRANDKANRYVKDGIWG